MTQTNELLTQLDCFEGLFFATINMMDFMDSACFRRFSHKIRFDYLLPKQRWELFVQESCRLGGSLADTVGDEEQVQKLEGLTPGYFAVVGRNWVGLRERLSAAEFVRLLAQEAAVKLHGKGKVGFI